MIMETRRLWICVHELNGVQAHRNSKYVLSYSNWNDFGYKTSFRLYLALDNPLCENMYNFGIASLSIVEHYPLTKGTRFLPKEGAANYHTYIMDINSAELMYLFLTYDERRELIDKLRIRFDDVGYSEQGNYLLSTLRNMTRQQFLDMQKKIKLIVENPNDVAFLIDKHRDRIKLFLGK